MGDMENVVANFIFSFSDKAIHWQCIVRDLLPCRLVERLYRLRTGMLMFYLNVSGFSIKRIDTFSR